jgi:hypothetical protein
MLQGLHVKDAEKSITRVVLTNIDKTKTIGGEQKHQNRSMATKKLICQISESLKRIMIHETYPSLESCRGESSRETPSPKPGSQPRENPKAPPTKPSSEPGGSTETSKQSSSICTAEELLPLQLSCGAREMAPQKLFKTPSIHLLTFLSLH